MSSHAPITVRFSGVRPEHGRPEDAGRDLRYDPAATEPIVIAPGRRHLIPTGTRISLPHGVSGKVCPRSGLALKHGITVLNSPGIIDPGYIGEIGVVLLNTDLDEAFTVNPGDRIAQLLIERFDPVLLVEDDDVLARRAPGFSREAQSDNTPDEKVGLTASHVQQIADFVAEHRA